MKPWMEKLKNLGFRYVVLDLEGYRTGSLNEGLEQKRSFGSQNVRFAHIS